MIYFIGGGFGSAEYLTVKGASLLRKANIVIYSKVLDKSILQICSKILWSLTNSFGVFLHISQIKLVLLLIKIILHFSFFSFDIYGTILLYLIKFESYPIL